MSIISQAGIDKLRAHGFDVTGDEEERDGADPQYVQSVFGQLPGNPAVANNLIRLLLYANLISSDEYDRLRGMVVRNSPVLVAPPAAIGHPPASLEGTAAARFKAMTPPPTPKIRSIPFNSDAQTQWLPPARLAQLSNRMTVRDSNGNVIGANAQTLSPAHGQPNLFSKPVEQEGVAFTEYYARSKASQNQPVLFPGQSSISGSQAWNVRKAVEAVPGVAVTVRQGRNGPEFAALDPSVKIKANGDIDIVHGAPEDQNIKHLKLGWQTDIVHLANRNTGQEAPVVSSAIVQRTAFGEKIRDQGQIVYYRLTSGMAEGQGVFVTTPEERVVGRQEFDVRGRVPNGADPHRFAQPQEWRGPKRTIGLPYGLQSNTKDWDWARTTGQAGFRPGSTGGGQPILNARVRLERFAESEAVKSVGTVKAAGAGWAPSYGNVQAEFGKTIFVTNATNVKLDAGFWQRALAGALEVKRQELGSLQAAVAHYGLQRVFRGGEVDWDAEDLEKKGSGSILRSAIQKVREEYTTKEGELQVPVLATFTRAGMYQWKRGRVNQELYSRIQEMDPQFARQLSVESNRIRGNYQDVLHAFNQMAGGVPGSADAIPMTQDIARRIHSTAAAQASESLRPSDITRAIETVTQNMNLGNAGSTFTWKTTFQGKQIDLSLPSSRQLRYFGHMWQDDFRESFDDPEDAEKAMKRWHSVVSQYTKSATELISYAAGVRPMDKEYEGAVRRYLSSVSQMAASNEFNKMSTSFFARRGGGGVAQGDTAVPLNTVAVGDAILQKLFPDLVKDADSLKEMKEFINGSNISALVMRNPSITRHQMPFLRLQSMDNIPNMSVQEARRGIFVNPRLMSLFGGDFDADQLLYLLRGKVRRNKEGKLVYKATEQDGVATAPASAEDIEGMITQMARSGGGLAEYHSSLEKQRRQMTLGGSISGFARLVIGQIGQTGTIGFGDIQRQFAYMMEAGKNMGMAYNLWRKGSAMLGGEARDSMDQVFDAIYKVFQDKGQLSPGMQKFWNFVTRMQPATGGLRPDFFGKMGFMGKGEED